MYGLPRKSLNLDFTPQATRRSLLSQTCSLLKKLKANRQDHVAQEASQMLRRLSVLMQYTTRNQLSGGKETGFSKQSKQTQCPSNDKENRNQQDTVLRRVLVNQIQSEQMQLLKQQLKVLRESYKGIQQRVRNEKELIEKNFQTTVSQSQKTFLYNNTSKRLNETLRLLRNSQEKNRELEIQNQQLRLQLQRAKEQQDKRIQLSQDSERTDVIQEQSQVIVALRMRLEQAQDEIASLMTEIGCMDSRGGQQYELIAVQAGAIQQLLL